MIEVFKILNGYYDKYVCLKLEKNDSLACTRGHHEIEGPKMQIRLKKIFYMWNSLDEATVTACSVNAFKNRLDKHWAGQEALYNWRV